MKDIDLESKIKDLLQTHQLEVTRELAAFLEENWITYLFEALLLVKKSEQRKFPPQIKEELEAVFFPFLKPIIDSDAFFKTLALVQLQYPSHPEKKLTETLPPGVFSALGTNFGAEPFQNPVNRREVRLSSNATFPIPIRLLIDDSNNTVMLGDSSDTFVKITLQNAFLKLSGVAVRMETDIGKAPQKVEMFSSVNDSSWNKVFSTVSEMKDYPHWENAAIVLTSKNLLRRSEYCRFFKLKFPVPDYLSGISQIELYGSLSTGPLEKVSRKVVKTFVYKEDFDTNGIVYWLGKTRKGFRNPVTLGTLGAEASSVQKSSCKVAALFEREIVRFCTSFANESFVSVDFSPNFVRLSHYTLMHYSSYDKEALRNWELQGFEEKGSIWRTIKKHVHDKALQKRGQSHTWSLNTGDFFYKFRILLTGPNSNKNHFLCLGGAEFYGTVKMFKPVDLFAVSALTQVESLPTEDSVRTTRFDSHSNSCTSLSEERNVLTETFLETAKFYFVDINCFEEGAGLLQLIASKGFSNNEADYRKSDFIEYSDSYTQEKTDEELKKKRVSFSELFTSDFTQKEEEEEPVLEKTFLHIKLKYFVIAIKAYVINYNQTTYNFAPPETWRVYGKAGAEQVLLSEYKNYQNFNEEDSYLSFPVSLPENCPHYLFSEFLFEFDKGYSLPELVAIADRIEIYGMLCDPLNKIGLARSQLVESSVSHEEETSGVEIQIEDTTLFGGCLDIIEACKRVFGSLNNLKFFQFSSSALEDSSGFVEQLFEMSSDSIITLKPNPDVFFKFELKEGMFFLKEYALLVNELVNVFGAIKSWKVEGSVDGTTWFVLDEITTPPVLQDLLDNTFAVISPRKVSAVKQIRLKQLGLNSLGKQGFSIAGFKVSGQAFVAHSLLRWEKTSGLLLTCGDTFVEAKTSENKKYELQTVPVQTSKLAGCVNCFFVAKTEDFSNETTDFHSLTVKHKDGDPNNFLLKLEKHFVKTSNKIYKFESLPKMFNLVNIEIHSDGIVVSNWSKSLKLNLDFPSEKDIVFVYEFKGTYGASKLLQFV